MAVAVALPTSQLSIPLSTERALTVPTPVDGGVHVLQQSTGVAGAEL